MNQRRPHAFYRNTPLQTPPPSARFRSGSGSGPDVGSDTSTQRDGKLSVRERANVNIRTAVLCGALLVVCAAAAHATRVVRMNVEMINGRNTGGLFVPERWSFVAVTITNNQQPFKGRILIRPDGTEGTAYERTVSITRGRKRFFLYFIPTPYRREYTLQLLDQDTGEEVKSLPVTMAMTSERVVMIAGNLMGFSEVRQSFAPVFAPAAYPIYPQSLPDRWLGYDMADTVILTPLNYKQLTEAQWDALKQWVWLGGHLVVLTSTSPDLFQYPVLEELLPVRMSGTITLPDMPANRRVLSLPLYPFAKAEVTKATLKEGIGQRLAPFWPERGPGGVLVYPAARRYYGFGRCTFVGLNMHAAPFAGVPPAPRLKLWREVLAPSERRGPAGVIEEWNTPVAALEKSFYDSITSKAAKPIPAWTVLLFSITYIVIVGPAAYYVVARQHRLLTGLVFGAGSLILFSGLAYFLSTYSRTNTYQVKDIQLMDVSLYDGWTHGHGRASAFLPRQGWNHLAVKGDHTWLGVRESPKLVERQGGKEVLISIVSQPGSDPTFDFRTTHWATRLIDYRWMRPPSGPSGTDALSRLQAFVENHAAYFKDAYLVHGTHCYGLGRVRRDDLRPDKDGNIKLRVRETRWDLSYAYSSTAPGFAQWPFGSAQAAVALCVPKTSVTDVSEEDRMYPRLSILRVTAKDSRLVLVGYTDEPRTVLRLDRFNKDERHVCVVRIPIPRELSLRFVLLK